MGFTPEENAPGTHQIGGWAGPRAVLEEVDKRYLLILLWSTSLQSSHYTNSAMASTTPAGMGDKNS